MNLSAPLCEQLTVAETHLCDFCKVACGVAFADTYWACTRCRQLYFNGLELERVKR